MKSCSKSYQIVTIKKGKCGLDNENANSIDVEKQKIKMLKNKINSMISLSKKAGKLAAGEGQCENAIKNAKAYLTLLSSDASKNTKKKFENSCFYYEVPIYKMDLDKEELGKLTGSSVRSVLCVLDEGFANSILKIMEDINITGGGPIA